MWEKDLIAQAQALGDNEGATEEALPKIKQWLKQQTHRVRLIAFFGRHDPIRLMHVSLLSMNRFRENSCTGAPITYCTWAESSSFDPLSRRITSSIIHRYLMASIAFVSEQRYGLTSAYLLPNECYSVSAGCNENEARVRGRYRLPILWSSHKTTETTACMA